MPVLLQVTIGASRTQVSSHGINFKQAIFQNNSTDSTVRIGDNTVVAGAYGTGKGILLSPSGSLNAGSLPIQAGILNNYYLAGANGTVIDILYEGA
jgi:hypothetical protein